MTENNIETYKKLYEKRIQAFITFLEQVNKKWMNKRTWYKDLEAFELGECFFENVFSADEDAPRDKEEFYTNVFIEASNKAQEEFGEQDDNLECGLEIERTIKEETEKKMHKKLLDYLWWVTIYKLAQKEFTEYQKLTLENKRKLLDNQIKAIESPIN
jgi:hypothetical protein